ncbi:porin [uncultured Parasutterella sp.]|uniref:porin n=1 Tax=uncultured Parasutterella sp. TaxID=1263098 RepID=UPI00272D843D|nr:porin [uncultured Parasutterella sp.]
MKKSLIMSALLCALSVPAAYAQSNVTLYGVIDGAIAVSKVKGGDTRIDFDNGIWAGSRFGIRGTEDLGSGYSIGFILEQGFKTFSGEAMNSSKAFARQSTLSITAPFGEAAFGRTGGLSSDCGTYTILHGSSLWTSYYNNGNIYGTFILSDRYDNMAVYKTPSFNGSTVTLMYSNGIGGDSEKWFRNDHYYGVGYEYAAGKTLFSAIWEMYDNKTSGYKASNVFTVGGSYDFGWATLYGAYQYANHSSRLSDYVRPDSMGKDGANQHGFSASIGIPAAGGTAKLQGNYGIGKIKGAEDDDYRLWSVATAYEYPISKRTLFYTYAGNGRGKKAVSSVDNYNSWTISIGLSHNF